MIPLRRFTHGFRSASRRATLLFLASSIGLQGQAPPAKPLASQAEAKDSASPYTIELLETRVRMEADGSSRSETHAVLHLGTLVGARQFARLGFQYNRAFEELDFPLVRVTHPGGGTVELLPSAISDQPVPAVADAPSFQDLRQKFVRIPGLQAGDTLEYRVTPVVKQAPLSPDFYYSHTFVRDVPVAKQIFVLDLPAAHAVQLHTTAPLPAPSSETSGEGGAARKIYRWEITPSSSADSQAGVPVSGRESASDISLTTFASWQDLCAKLADRFSPALSSSGLALAKSNELTRGTAAPEQKLEKLYDFVSQKVRTLDLNLGETGYRLRPLADILSSGYAIPEEKVAVLAALSHAAGISTRFALAGAPEAAADSLPSPSPFTRVLVEAAAASGPRWLDPSVEVAPFGLVSPNFRGKPTLVFRAGSASATGAAAWTTIPPDPPFAATQRVTVDAALASDGKLTARVRYVLRGDSELVLRTAFHRAPHDRWKDLAQLLAISDGFRGSVTNVSASDPSATSGPFTVEYEIAQPKFADWSKQPVRIPALLPFFGLPDVPAKRIPGAASPIDLGTPLDIEAQSTLHLPPRTVARGPAGASVERDYAAYSSKYAKNGPALTVSRHLKFILREIPAARIADYSAFVRAIRNDEAQEFALERAALPNSTKQASPKAAAPAKPKP